MPDIFSISTKYCVPGSTNISWLPIHFGNATSYIYYSGGSCFRTTCQGLVLIKPYLPRRPNIYKYEYILTTKSVHNHNAYASIKAKRSTSCDRLAQTHLKNKAFSE